LGFDPEGDKEMKGHHEPGTGGHRSKVCETVNVPKSYQHPHFSRPVIPVP